MTKLTKEEVLKIYDRVFHYHFQQPHQINNILTVAAEIQDAYQAKNADLEAELERERMRLAACGTAALGYFEGCCDEYKSASLDDVLRLRAENAALREGFGEPVAWRIKFKSVEHPDFLTVHYHGTNAITDYRQIDPDAVCEPLYARKDKS